jgi:prevent-host-death family protein
MTSTEVKAKLHSLLDEVENGEEIEITRHGRTVARLSSARRHLALKNKFAGIARTACEDDNLYSASLWPEPPGL